LPIALAPTPGWDDADGCFTGSAVDDHGTATILYTGVKRAPLERSTVRDGHNDFREVQCLATSTDPQLRNWQKHKRPVIEPPNNPKITGFRDPFLWRQGNDWLLGVASGHAKLGGCVLLYRSKDLRSWEYLHELASGKWTEKELVEVRGQKLCACSPRPQRTLVVRNASNWLFHHDGDCQRCKF
jgi:beta-fructofuranosidase